MSTIYKDHKLDKAEVKALKSADTVCIDLNMRQTYSCLRAIREKRNTSDGFEQTVYIDCDAIVELRRGYSDVSHDYPNVKAYEYLGSAQYYDEWRTIADMLREGDVIRIHWDSTEPGDKNGGYSGNAVCTLPEYRNLPLYHDTVKIEIKRGSKRMVFNMRDSHCPANSAQMIKWDGRSW